MGLLFYFDLVLCYCCEQSYSGDSFLANRNRRTLSEEIWTGRLVEGDVRTKECQNHIGRPPLPPQSNISGRDSFKLSRPTDSTELATCNECRPAIISVEDIAGDTKNKKKNKMLTMMGHRRSTTMSTDTHLSSSSVQLPMKTRPSIVSWLFPRPKKTSSSSKTETVEPEANDCGIQTLELLKKEAREAKMSRDVALAEAGEMKLTLEDLKTKMTQLETYCKDLKNTYRQTVYGKRDIKTSSTSSPGYLTRRRGISGRKKFTGDNSSSGSNNSTDLAMPVSYEVMLEGFLQIVSEARSAVTQFCKTLIDPVTGLKELPGNLTSLLFPESSSSSGGSIYKLEAVITQSLYQDFENCVFQNNGHPKFLNPQKERREKFATFVSLRNLTWNQVLDKGTNFYSEDFSKFCDFKMNRVVTTLLDRSSTPWHEELLHSFFVSTKCVWLVHLLAFSFDPPLAILRVGENFRFDAAYMRDVKTKGYTNARVKFMVTPGFYVREKVIKCKVFCTHK